jgi:hypothetical protein
VLRCLKKNFALLRLVIEARQITAEASLANSRPTLSAQLDELAELQGVLRPPGIRELSAADNIL